MGDRVAVMRKGELQQVGPPQELYDRPVNLFVGGFIGSPAMNMLEATLERANGGLDGSPAARAALGERRSRRARRCGLRGQGRWSSASARRTSRTPRSRPKAGRPLPDGPSTSSRGARLRDHGALLDRGEAAETEETQELARDSRAETAELPRRREGGGDGRPLRRPVARPRRRAR